MRYDKDAQKSPPMISAEEWNRDLKLGDPKLRELAEDAANVADKTAEEAFDDIIEGLRRSRRRRPIIDWWSFALGLLTSSVLWWIMIVYVWKLIG